MELGYKILGFENLPKLPRVLDSEHELGEFLKQKDFTLEEVIDIYTERVKTIKEIVYLNCRNTIVNFHIDLNSNLLNYTTKSGVKYNILYDDEFDKFLFEIQKEYLTLSGVSFKIKNPIEYLQYVEGFLKIKTEGNIMYFIDSKQCLRFAIKYVDENCYVIDYNRIDK